MLFSEKIRARRKQLGYTQTEAAKELNIQQSQYSQYERHITPQRENWAKICNFLKLDPKTLNPIEKTNTINDQIPLFEDKLGIGIFQEPDPNIIYINEIPYKKHPNGNLTDLIIRKKIIDRAMGGYIFKKVNETELQKKKKQLEELKKEIALME